ncbi:hypothetical protein TRFO_09729 [Tritrichomonas foetus]|uniref:Uncharacterized protein n=1 Tax=Tritrichomonas foetus TaxID=1144522 RepID=A0A1J4JEW4_9EUKA|nr:hypothetical protein TRFO_09729 [Tritrichomonas foetus]|eukprot:OHS96839.1 hypothetical protein TRFO_09729 [Tritrichomonas foetus]
MPAKSVAGFSRSGRLSDTRSMAGMSAVSKSSRYSNASDLNRHKTRISEAALQNKTKFEGLMENVLDNINKLFFDQETKSNIIRAFYEANRTGLELTKIHPKRYTEETVSNFFSKWSNFAININYFYEEIDASERLIRFVDEYTKDICEIIEPLKNYIFDEDYPKEAKNAKKMAEICQTQFESNIGIMSQQVYKYTKDEINLDDVLKTVQQLIISIKSHSNTFFHQPRKDSKEILFQTHMKLQKILDALYDFGDDEKMAFDCIEILNRTTKKLKLLFKYKIQSDDDRISVQQFKLLRRTIPRADPVKISKYVESVISEKELKNERSDQNDDVSVISKKSKTQLKKRGETYDNINGNNSNNTEFKGEFFDDNEFTVTTPKLKYLKDKEKIEMEISELKSKIEDINNQISVFVARTSLTPDQIHQQRKSQYVEIFYSNQLINEKIRFIRDFNQEIKKELKSWNKMNSELHEISEIKNNKYNDFTKKAYRLSSNKLDDEIDKLTEELSRLTHNLNTTKNQTAKSTRISESHVNREEIITAIHSLTKQNEGIQNYITEMNQQEKYLQNLSSSIHNNNNSDNDNKNKYFSDDRIGKDEDETDFMEIKIYLRKKKEDIHELENYLKKKSSTKPSKQKFQLPSDLEEMRFSDLISSKATKFQESLEVARDKYVEENINQSKEILNDLVDELSQKDNEKVKLLKLHIKAMNEGNFDFLNKKKSKKLKKELFQKYQLQNEAEIIEKWFKKVCPQLMKPGMTLSQKTDRLLKFVKSRC